MSSDNNKRHTGMFVWVLAGFGLSGFAIIIADLIRRTPVLGEWSDTFIDRFFPPVQNGLGILVSSLFFLGLAGAISYARRSRT